MPHTYFLDPLDVLLFRDGRPRVTGDSHLMTGPFPPPPSAFYGAFRSALLAQDDARFTPLATQSGDGYAPTGATTPFQNRSDAVAEAVGTPAQTGTLTLDRVLLAQRTSSDTVPLFPVGLDLVRPKDDARAKERLLLRPVDDGPIRTSLPEGLRRLAVPGEADFLEALPAYLTPEAFTSYLQGDVAGLPLAAMQAGPEAPFGVSARTSVMLKDAGGTAADGMLYTTEFVRLRKGAQHPVRLCCHRLRRAAPHGPLPPTRCRAACGRVPPDQDCRAGLHCGPATPARSLSPCPRRPCSV